MKSLLKKGIISIGVLLILLPDNDLFAQTSSIIPNGSTSQFMNDIPILPAAFRYDATINYVRTWEPWMPITDPIDVTLQPVADVKQSTTYVDGLARVIQTVIKQSSPMQKDLVSYKLFDEYGRETIQYLPYTSTETDGNFKTNGVSAQRDYFDMLSQTNQEYANEHFCFSKTNIETNPFQRPEKVMAPGNSWTGNERGVKYKHGLNSEIEQVRIWKIEDAIGSIPVTEGIYNSGTLYKTIVIDEQEKSTIEYKDKDGKVILKKVQIEDIPTENHIGWLCTYYVYDDYGLLRFVIQPKAIDIIVSAIGSVSWDLAPFVTELCFRYEYDDKGRMIIKNVPGAGEVSMVYDSRDRLVMTKDANQHIPGKWAYTIYDNSNRPLKTGIILNSNDRIYHQTQANSGINYPNPSLYPNDELTITNYDKLSNSLITTDINKLDAGTNSWPEPVVESSLLYGKVTGTTVTVPGDIAKVYTFFVYDNKERIIQTNIKWNKLEVTTTNLYDFSGKVLSTYENHFFYDGNLVQSTILNKMAYDAGGRLIKTWKQINNDGVDHLISENIYNELGELKTKNLGTSTTTTSGHLETLEYDYNIRGWLTSINKQFVNDATGANWFGQMLSYDHGFNNAYFNGNISGLKWRSKGDGEQRAYGFKYDNANRLLLADFNQFTNSTWNKDAQINFSMNIGGGVHDSRKSYDANGNIMMMQQMGLKVNQSYSIDNLLYTYQHYSNKLKNVVDLNNDELTRLGDFRTSANHPQRDEKLSAYTSGGINIDNIIDYSYDGNGNLIKDYNKDIGNTGNNGIVYNYLNLPQTITIRKQDGSIKGTIRYLYDATGNKLEKIVNEGTKETKTTYFSGIVYERTQVEGEPAAPNIIQFIGHPEGRVRYAKQYFLNGDSAYNFQYDYFLKDHLGNVRSVLTEQKDVHRYFAGFETATREKETALFANIPETAIQISSIPGYPTDVTTDPNQYTSRLNGSGKRIGAGLTLKVMVGDKIDLATKCWYPEIAPGTYPGHPVEDILLSLLNTLSAGASGLSGGKTSVGDLINPDVLTPGINTFNNLHTEDPGNPQNPKAYLNWVLFDEQFKYVPAGSGFKKVPGYNAAMQTLAEQGINIPKSGYLFVYLSNETSGRDVFFDNLVVQHYTGPLLEETHYYPFGLVMAGISSKAAGSLTNKVKYGGKELQAAEFSDGSGLEMYDFGARYYDAQLGVWHSPDPLAAKYPSLSPYMYAFNNPILFVDPDGRDNIVYLYAADGSVSKKQLKQIAKQATANFATMGLKTQVRVFKGTFNKEAYGKLDKTDAVAVIGNPDALRKSIASYNPGFAKELGSGFGSSGGTTDGVNPEQSQNPRGSNVQSDGNIIAVGTKATQVLAKDGKSTFEEGAAFVINHGAGHNANMNHAGGSNGYDENGNYNAGAFVPQGPNVMSEGNRLSNGQNLQSFITAPANRQPANDGYISIQKMYMHRFGNNTPTGNAALPTQ